MQKIYHWLKWKQAYHYRQAWLQAWKARGIQVHNSWTLTVLWQNNYLLFFLKSSWHFGQVVQKCICNTTETNFLFFPLLTALWLSLWCSLRSHELADLSMRGDELHAPGEHVVSSRGCRAFGPWDETRTSLNWNGQCALGSHYVPHTLQGHSYCRIRTACRYRQRLSTAYMRKLVFSNP